MEQVLVVTNPFGGWAKGDVITDAAEIAEIEAGEHAASVVRAAHPAAADEG